ncbi:MAG: hypothetical protein JWP89_2285 [Schlesneria sp.]|nr:hypothetical protein [Schlesneria sp.]
MDGGIYDNQGIESILLSEERAGLLDMIIMSDTDRQEEALFQMPDSVAGAASQSTSQINVMWKLFLGWNPTLGILAWLSWLLLALCWLSVGALGLNLWNQFNSPQPSSVVWALLTNIVPLLLTVSAAGLLALFRSTFKNKLLSQVPQLQLASWKYLSKVRLVNTIDMCWFRISSLMALTSNVFMKRIRSNGYRSIFQDPEHQGKLVSNFIYSIRTTSSKSRRVRQADEISAGAVETQAPRAWMTIPPASERLCAVTEAAAAVPTLLWFQNDEELPNLVATGQATTCLSLMRFISQTRCIDENSEAFAAPEVQELWLRLQRDWASFQVDPFYLTPDQSNDLIPANSGTLS